MSSIGFLHPAKWTTLLSADARNVTRDPTLLFVTIFAFVPLVGFGIWGADIDNWVSQSIGLDNFTHYALPVLLVVPATLFGWVSGFLLLEDRDDGPLIALDVTPMGRSGFFGYRIGITAIVAFALTLLGLLILAPGMNGFVATIISVLLALEAVCFAFALPGIARNKVEGLALSKVLNLFSIMPLLALIPAPWRYLTAPLPTFWLGELIYNPQALPLPFAIGAALIIHLVCVWLCARLALNRLG